MKAKIVRVWIEKRVDEEADLSYLGEYAASAQSEWAVDRRANGDGSNEEYRYWNSGGNHVPPGKPENWSHVTDEDVWAAVRKNNATLPDGVIPSSRASAIEALDLHYIQEDYQRCEGYNRGDWNMVDVIAKAEVRSTQGIIQVLHSGGLWGIESDSDASYFEEIAGEELAGLRAELENGTGFGKRAVDYAFKSVERDE
jgi:hypothetical protein